MPSVLAHNCELKFRKQVTYEPKLLNDCVHTQFVQLCSQKLPCTKNIETKIWKQKLVNVCVHFYTISQKHLYYNQIKIGELHLWGVMIP